MRRLFSAVVSAALLISLCACNMNDPLIDDPFARETASARPSRAPDSSDAPDGSETPDPMVSPPPEYDKSHRLDASIPALIDGLEMPIAGATGYTSVELPVWPSRPDAPEESEPPEDPEPDPTPVEPPDVTEPPETDPPEETGEPAPDDPAESDPGPDASAETEDPEGAGSTQDPAQSEPPPLVSLFPPDASEPAETPELTETPEPTPEPEPEPTETADPYEGAVAVWEPGTAFVILEEEEDWWYVSRGDEVGWIEHRYCMINLPDVIPSMLYDDVDAYSALFVASGKNIPGITGEEIYNGNDTWTYNVRLDRSEFIMPILYSAARNICAAQHKALAEGNCLVVYQTFRPYDTQVAVARAVSSLAKVDPEVKAGISTPPWSIDWFIATGVSNHQRGYALDVSMVKVYGTETRYVGSLPYLYMTDYEDYAMPTAMHELSFAAATTVSPNSGTLSESMNVNAPAKAMRSYFTSSGLSPLASEWWHFNDDAAMRATADKPSNGRYYLTECLSRLAW